MIWDLSEEIDGSQVYGSLKGKIREHVVSLQNNAEIYKGFKQESDKISSILIIMNIDIYWSDQVGQDNILDRKPNWTDAAEIHAGDEETWIRSI